jgi:hypothetical protein
MAIAGFMTLAAAGTKNGGRAFASRLVLFIALLTFALQSYIAQTHIHGQGLGGLVQITSAQSPDQGKAPLDNRSTDCPFCQAVNLAGVFLDPAALVVLLPLSWVDSVSHIILARAVFGDTAHDWQSRAPPRR